MGLSGMGDRCNVLVTRHPVTDENSWHPRVLAHRSDSEEGGRKWRREFEMARPTTTPGAPDTGQGARPPGQPPTPKCLFPLDAKNGTEVAPVEPDVLADGLLGAMSSPTGCWERTGRSPFWPPHTPNRRRENAFPRRLCVTFKLSNAHASPDGLPRANLRRSFSSYSRNAALQRR
jgi:hypothetical protein